jgi:hypothetical protein
VYRLVIITEMSPSDPIFQAELMVEYEPVEIGGQSYVCPRKSVSITTAVSPAVRQTCAYGNCFVSNTAMPKDTAINDTEYDSASYHVFRSEARIVTDWDAGSEDKTAPDGAVPATANPKP